MQGFTATFRRDELGSRWCRELSSDGRHRSEWRPLGQRTESPACSWDGVCGCSAGICGYLKILPFGVVGSTTIELKEQLSFLKWCWEKGSSYRHEPCIYNPLG